MNRTDGVKERIPVSQKAIERVQSECTRLDDDIRWITALISGTGMRLAEAIGLAKTDIVLDHEYPHLVLQQHPWQPLKTATSGRLVPIGRCITMGVRRRNI